MFTDSVSVYYFQYKQVSNQQAIIGRLSETEIGNLLPSVVKIATPEIYPPGCIVWYSGELTAEALADCQWLTFLARIDRLEWTKAQDWSADRRRKLVDRLRKDYDAFEDFLSAATLTPILVVDKDWVATVTPQAFAYQSPARQSPYLIRAMVNLSHNKHRIGRVLDPMGGYGQALFECVLRGVDGTTLEISPTASRRSADNLRRLLQRLELPFEESDEGNVHLFTTQTGTYQIINGDTRIAHRYLSDERFDSLITDFPYGVQVGSRTEKMVPTDYDGLLDAALPSWKRLLKSNGTVVIAYNLYTLSRQTVLNLIEKHGFCRRYSDVDLSMWISHKIHRDIVAFKLN